MADTKLTALPDLGALSLDDLVYVVNAPGGTPASGKVTVQQLLALPTVTGTWTPGLAGDSGSGVTYTDRYGYFVKTTTPEATIVFASGYLVISTLGTVAGTAYITGFPSPFYGANFAPLQIASWSGLPTAWSNLWIRGINSDTRAYIMAVPPAGSDAPGSLAVSNLANGCALSFQGTYRTA